MNAEHYIQNGQLKEALAALQEDVRSKPQDARLRVSLFQLDCVLGALDKALIQLQVLSNMNADTMLMAQIFQPIVACELLRREVFAGKRTPLIFGEPAEWVGLLVQASQFAAKGQFEQARAFRDQAYEAAPATVGKVNDTSFEWIADADSRIGPLLEAMISGKYYWVPFSHIQRLQVPKPSDLRDLVWAPAQFTWVNGGEAAGHIPCRYPDTENAVDDALRMARRTNWTEPVEGYSIGLGQRLLTTDAADYPLLECRDIMFNPPAPS
jgi:type VI secretion system protein ImpE